MAGKQHCLLEHKTQKIKQKVVKINTFIYVPCLRLLKQKECYYSTLNLKFKFVYKNDFN